jgi:hypothetical protein
MVKRLFICLLAAAAVSLVPQEATASEFSFDCITNKNATNCGILENQLAVTIGLNATKSSMVDFLFTNSGPAASSITGVYFDDPSALLGPPGIISSSSGVSFDKGCTPPKLPGGNPYGFTTSYCADSNAPTKPKGVNPTEWLRLSYALQGVYTLDDVLDAIAEGTFQVGIQVQGFKNGRGESGILDVTPNVTPVPEPGTLLLFGAGALAAGAARRRRKAVA